MYSPAILLFGIWIFVVWRLAGMPSPGFVGRIIPAAWVLAGILNGRAVPGKWFLPMAFSFTLGAWLWMLHPNAWMIAAALPVAGLVAWGISIARNGRSGVIRGILPVLLLSLITTEITGDEVRFAEIASSSSGISTERFDEIQLRTGDLSGEIGHHTTVFPLLISPGLLAGDNGLRIVPVLIALFGVLLLARLTDPRIAVAAALLYPGFSILGLAMTGWLALCLFTLGVLLPEGRKWSVLRFLLAAALVLIKMRYAGLAAGIVIVEYMNLPSGKKKWLIPILGITVCILLLIIDRYILGGTVFIQRYGNIQSLRLILVNAIYAPLTGLSNAGWSLFDPEAGLIMRAPWVLSAIPGLFLFRRKSPLLFRRLFIPSMVYWIVLVVWSGQVWHGLPAPTGRMFLPVLPLFACGLSFAWGERRTRLLVILSIGVTALVVACPLTRYNYADGSDSILTLLGTVSGFSIIRSHPVLLFIPVLLLLLLLFLFRRTADNPGILSFAILSALLLLGLGRSGLEAEDLPASIAQGTQLYPELPDPVMRYYWPVSIERMLVLGEVGQSILLPDMKAGDTLSLELSGSGGIIAVGAQHLTVETPLSERHPSFRFVRRSDSALDDRPENRVIETFAVPLRVADLEDGSIRISHDSGPPVYIDEIRVLR